MRLSVHQFRQLMRHFQWLHQVIGVLGGLTFFVGSIFFLYDDVRKQIGTWLFIIGSAGMLIGNLGSVIVRYGIEKSEHDKSEAPGYVEPIG